MATATERAEKNFKVKMQGAANKMRIFLLSSKDAAKSVIEKQYVGTMARIASGDFGNCENCNGPMPIAALNRNFFETTCCEDCKQKLQFQKLSEKIISLEGEIKEIEKSVRQTLIDESTNCSISNHPADQSKLPNYKLDHLLPNKKKLLSQYKTAIKMHQEGTYGVCEECGKDINPARLEVSPSSNRCVECKTKIEERSKVSSGYGNKVSINRLRQAVYI
ncbi:MAG: TraR/DksA C4-type zinc finger protein [bacterium]